MIISAFEVSSMASTTVRKLSLLCVALSAWGCASPPAVTAPVVTALEIKKTVVDDEPHFVDWCVGGTAHELLAQANILTARDHPGLGLSRNLAMACPRFVWTVMRADSLKDEERRKVFSEVALWNPTARLDYFLCLHREVLEAYEHVWRYGPVGRTARDASADNACSAVRPKTATPP